MFFMRYRELFGTSKFIEYDETVFFEVIGPRKQGVELVVPCHYMFCAKKKLISKLCKKLDKHWFVQRPNAQNPN